MIATGSTLQALLGAYWIRSRAGFPLKLEGPRELGRLLLLVGPFTCLVGATVGTATLFASGVVAQSNLINFWLRWWGGDMGGVLIVVPLLFLAPWSRGAIHWRGQRLAPFSTVAFIAILVLLFATLAAWRLNMEAAYERSQTSFESLAADSRQALDHQAAERAAENASDMVAESVADAGLVSREQDGAKKRSAGTICQRMTWPSNGLCWTGSSPSSMWITTTA